MPNNLKKIYRKDPETISRMIDNELVVLPLGKDVGINDLGVFYILKNETARCIWDLIDGKRSIDGITKAVAERFEIEPKKAMSDILDFLKELEEIKAIV